LSSSLRAGAAGALGASAGRVLAQNAAKVQRPGRFEENTLIAEKKPFTWPGGATLAVWIIPNVEVFILNPAGNKERTQGDQDVLGYTWREYGNRVGLWRIVDVMEQAGVRATVALNAGVCDVFPKAIEEMDKRGWEMMGHNVTNSRSLRNLSLDQEERIIHTTVEVIKQATGKKVRGWLGTGLGETFSTLDVLAEAGVEYTGDWNNDDVPYPMKAGKGSIYALNYGNAINDISFYGKGHTGEEYFQMVSNQFDTLYADSKKIPRVMGIPLHPFHTGQPLRIKYFQKTVQHMKEHDKVWFATGGEILDAYLKSQG
jgi:peptidoglycan/xylan/chitin deacetylase (PgdA/CDA1 family)